MKYKITLSDNSFIIADENYKITIFFMLSKKTITVQQYLDNLTKYDRYYMMDKIGTDRIRRTFTIEETDLDFPIGSRIKYAKDIV